MAMVGPQGWQRQEFQGMDRHSGGANPHYLRQQPRSAVTRPAGSVAPAHARPLTTHKPYEEKKRKLDNYSDSGPYMKKSKTKYGEADDTEAVNGFSAPQVEEELSVDEREGAFTNFRISQITQDKLRARNATYLFPVQYKTFDDVYDGNDVIAQARTGTGKTFAFAVPIAEKLALNPDHQRGRAPKVLVLAPTRELAKQVCNDFEAICTLKLVCIYGGAPYAPQENALYAGCDVVVGTPGRVLDFVEKGTLYMKGLQHVVLDEVDRMLDMGFAESVDDIIKSVYDSENPSNNPQTLLFSATLPSWVYTTARKYMRDDVKKVDLIGSQRLKTSTTVQHLAIKCGYQDRASTIGDIIKVHSGNHGRAMVFCQTKRDADELAISTAIKQESHVLHGDIPQNKREIVLKSFKDGRYKCLITTDVAARGLDIPEVDLVIQCSPPKDVDSYIHRAGRTGRAGKPGTCVCFYKPKEDYDLGKVERIAGIKFKRIGAPSTDAIIRAAAEDAARALETIQPETLLYFRESAERLLEQKDAVDALAAALAVISGNTEIKSRSLITASEGYTTYLFRSNMKIERLGYCWRSLERHFPPEVKEKVTRMRFCADKMGCVFDLPCDLDTVVADRWADGKYDTLVKATELPELLEEEGGGYGGGNSGWRNSGGNSYGGNSYGRNSYGGGNGGFSRGGSSFGRGRGGDRGGDRGYNSGGFRGGRGGSRGGSSGGFSSRGSYGGAGGGNFGGDNRFNSRKTF